MSLEKIIGKIIDDARSEAQVIVEESKAKAEEIKAAARREAQDQAERLITEYQKQGKLEASRIVTQARLERQISSLVCKKELIAEVIDTAFKQEKISKDMLKRKVVLKDGEKEEYFSEDNLKEELRPHLEGFIAEVLQI
jgi:vacuolar-type H+-ATPase subunit E/Vma4